MRSIASLFHPDSRSRFFLRRDWVAFWISTLISFGVYFLTCAPSVTMEDSGELAVAGDYAGVPHPPGYPSWTLCAWVFARLLGWISFRGHPNPVWAIAVMSAFWGALATGLMALLLSRTTADLLSGGSGENESAQKRNSLICLISGIAGSLIFAFTPVMWSQCTIVEVYSFNAFFLMLVLVLTYRWMSRPSSRTLLATAFIFGLGLTNYQVLLLAIVPLVFVILLQNRALFRDFVLAGIPFGLVAYIMKLGSLYSQPGFPKHSFSASTESAIPYILAISGRAINPSGHPAAHSMEQLAREIAFSHHLYWAILAAGTILLFSLLALHCFMTRQKRTLRGLTALQTLTRPEQLSLFSVILSALLLLALCIFCPAAVAPAEFAQAAPEQTFSWLLPAAAFIGGFAALLLFSHGVRNASWYLLAVSAIILPLLCLLKKGALLGLTHPGSGYFEVYVLLNFVFIFLAARFLEHGKLVAGAILAVELGLLFYLYMPIASDSCPPMNWGYPRTWAGFKHAISRGQYEQISPTTMFSPLFIHQLGVYFSDLRMQFTLLLANFGFIPFAVWAFLPAQDTDSPRSRTFRKIIIIATGALALFSLLYFAVSGPAKNAALRPDKILSLFLLLLSCIGLHLLILGRFIPLLRNAFRSEGALSERIIGGLCAAGIFLFIMGFALGFLNAIAEFFLESALGITAEAGLRYTLLNSSLTLILFSGWLLFALWLALGEWHRKPRFSFPIPETLARWHLVTFVCFLMMSLVLIALANPSGTIPDMFIQKVKFIASHALFALWICYGFAYLLKFLSTRKKTVLLQAGCALVLLTPLIPIAENYTNAYLVDISSAADQNNNDLGWQFGAYSLEGAPRIQCELSAAEEPPPNPLYPPPMTKDAVFFGGTDAGRFVPTYMIYSAKMREDVFLITQNALADGTYLDTMRGLYADQLWMPTTWDNSDAFNQYRIEVETGKRPNRGGISYGPGGGISVNGALAVMEINGILTEKLFEHNSARHDFYVEESYPIQWMMPFLRPHGLILKLEASPIAISPQEIRSDADFWDWYTRRLLNHPHFLRDIPARKGFSKLRSAIANILSLHRHTEEANRAWIQSQALYFRSPEPIFRRVQDVLLPQERYTDVLFLMDELEQLDPNMNTEPLEMARDLCRAGLRTEEAEKRLDAGEKLREEEFLELVHNYIALKKNTRLNMILKDTDRIVENPSPVLTCKTALVFWENQLYDTALSLLKSVDIKLLLSLPPADLDIIADVFLANRDWRTADQLLVKLLRDPQQSRTNFRAWCNLAYTSFHLSNPDRARRSFNCALSVNQQETYAYLQMMQDTVFLRFLFPPKANPRYPAGPVMHRP